MDLDTLIAQQLNQPKKVVNTLLPKQQQNRSYNNVQKQQQKLHLNVTRYLIDEYKNEWMMWYDLDWPVFSTIDKKTVTKNQLINFAKEYIELKSNRGEEKYFKIKHIDTQKMQIIFDVEKWIRDAFGNVRQRFSPPLSLIYKTRTQIPMMVYSTASIPNLNKFLSKKFKEYLKSNTRKLKHKNFGFLKKYSADLFDYKFDFRANSFIATLKYSVVLASLAAYMIWKNHKSLSKSEIKSLQRKASSMKDIKQLNRYLKHL